MRRSLFPILFCAILLSACHRQGILSFKAVEYIPEDSIDYNVESSSGKRVDLGIDGIQYFQIVGPYIVLLSPAESGFFTVLEKNPPYNELGSFFRKGRGPGELPAMNIPGNWGQNSEGEVYADLNNLTGKIVRWNITRSILQGRTVTEEIGETGKTTFSTENLGEEGIYHKELGPDKDRQERYIMTKDSVKYIPKNMRLLNEAILQNKEDDGARFNILSTEVEYDSETKRIIEASSGLNTIHIYSIDGDFAKTFCIGDRIYNYNDLADRGLADRPITTIDGKNFGNFCAFLYLDVPMAAFARPESIPRLLLVPWDGSSITQIKLPDKITSFDIDIESGLLFGYSALTESMRTYDISGIISSLNPK